jgi:hypothetical protein
LLLHSIKGEILNFVSHLQHLSNHHIFIAGMDIQLSSPKRGPYANSNVLKVVKSAVPMYVANIKPQFDFWIQTCPRGDNDVPQGKSYVSYPVTPYSAIQDNVEPISLKQLRDDFIDLYASGFVALTSTAPSHEATAVSEKFSIFLDPFQLAVFMIRKSDRRVSIIGNENLCFLPN